MDGQQLNFALDGIQQRQQVIANNITNENTPDYQAKVVTFETSLADAVANGGTAVATVTPEGLPSGTNGNNVTVNLTGGKTTSLAYNPGPSTNPYAKTVLNGPMNYIAAASLFKVFPISERVNLRFNWDIFNVLNDQGYLNPNGTDGTENLQAPYNALSPNGGGNGPRVMQFTLRLSF